MNVKHFFTGNCKDPGQPQNGGRIGDGFIKKDNYL